jgi:tetratricopeptide (TPR) repeat protein
MNSEDEEDRQYVNEHYNAAHQHYRDAIADFDRAISIDDSLVSPYKYRAIVKTMLGDYREAISDYLFIIEMNNYSFNTYCVIANSVNCQGINENDRLMVERVSGLKDAYVHLAHEKSRLGDDRGAIEDFARAITIDRKNSSYYLYRGIVKRKLGDYQGAIEDFSHSIENKGTMACYERGITKNESGDYQGAIEDFTQDIINRRGNLFNKHNSYYNRGTAKSKLEDYQGAIADYDRAIIIDNNNPSAYRSRGNAKGNLGDDLGAIEDYQRAMERYHYQSQFTSL